MKEGDFMTLEYLIQEWELIKKEIKVTVTGDSHDRLIRYARTIYETALDLYGYDLYAEHGGL